MVITRLFQPTPSYKYFVLIQRFLGSLNGAVNYMLMAYKINFVSLSGTVS